MLVLDPVARSAVRSADWSRHPFQGQTPSISTSSEKLSTIRINTISPSTPTLSSDWVDQDRPDDVGDDQHLEAEQDHASKVRAQLPERVGRVPGDLLRIAPEGDEPADDHDGAAEALDDLDDIAGCTLVAHPPTLAKITPRGLTIGTNPMSRTRRGSGAGGGLAQERANITSGLMFSGSASAARRASR